MARFLAFAALRIAGRYLCSITCTFAYTVTCLCWMRFDSMQSDSNYAFPWFRGTTYRWQVPLHCVCCAAVPWESQFDWAQQVPHAVQRHLLWRLHFCTRSDMLVFG